ncbi:uncharacterized protein [Glycine max]|uniref:uncharacterized protein n=1 Tax=Glycine max TaxID=3847 RepID=UPI0003DE81AC|nr:uncharacterized protein LOC102664511 [Glycine max]|eukprot:XP_006579154.1 uncharacterized protein LOC102664511 [Glycine max]
MPLYAKFLKDMLTKKNRYIYSDIIVVEDLGASINLMPLPMCRRLGEIKIMPARMTLQLAYHSITRPYGVIEDVLVKVKHLIFLADFIVIDIEEDADIPLILGHPFMSTASYVVDMGKKILQMGIED